MRGLEREMKRGLPGERARARRALEIGCGPGRLLKPMAEKFGEIHGVDVSDEMIGLARRRLTEIPHAHAHVGGCIWVGARGGIGRERDGRTDGRRNDRGMEGGRKGRGARRGRKQATDGRGVG